MSATTASRNYRKFKRAANAHLKKIAKTRQGADVERYAGDGAWWWSTSRAVAKKIRREGREAN